MCDLCVCVLCNFLPQLKVSTDRILHQWLFSSQSVLLLPGCNQWKALAQFVRTRVRLGRLAQSCTIGAGVVLSLVI